MLEDLGAQVEAMGVLLAAYAWFYNGPKRRLDDGLPGGSAGLLSSQTRQERDAYRAPLVPSWLLFLPPPSRRRGFLPSDPEHLRFGAPRSAVPQRLRAQTTWVRP